MRWQGRFTEIGLGAEPEATFSTCFGGPFMPRHLYACTEMLKGWVLKHGATCWLVNTGCIGEPFGVAERSTIRCSSVLLNAVVMGKLKGMEFRRNRIFGFDGPAGCEGVPAHFLSPANT